MWILLCVLAIGLAVIAVRRVSARKHRKAALHAVPVREAMQRHIDTVAADESLEIVATRLVATGLDQLPIVDHGRPVGVVTREDVATGIREMGPDAEVLVAPHHGVVTVDPDDPLDTVIDRLDQARDAVAVVVDRGTPIGVLSQDHLATYLTLHGPQR